ncbi:MAG: acyltransferase family protein [Desulfocapsaceae bacterium]|nr:acyltransferase family protein [Desulfocapsaceae bacterium]
MQQERNTLIFSRQESNAIKGVAIIMLILHHLFLFPSEKLWFTSVLGNDWGGIEFFLSSVGKLCIPLFFFISGYGIWQSSRKDCHLWQSTLRRVQSIYIIYIVTVLVTVLLLFLWSGSLPLKSWRQAVETLIGINVSINGSWWFFIIYVELLLLTPTSVFIVRRYSSKPLLLLSFLLYLLSAPVSGFYYFSQIIERIGLTSLFYNSFPVNLFWPNQLYFFTGFCLAASGIFEKALQFSLKKLHHSFWRYSISSLLIIALLLLRYFFIDIADFFGVLSKKGLNIFSYIMINSRIDFILAPVFIFALILLLYQKKCPFLSLLGKHSAAIWLIHGTILIMVTKSLKEYHPWSPLVFLVVLFFCVLYALAFKGIKNLCSLVIFRCC